MAAIVSSSTFHSHQTLTSSGAAELSIFLKSKLPKDTTQPEHHLLCDVLLVERDHAVVLLVHVQVLDETLLQEVVEAAHALHQLVDVRVLYARHAVVDDDVRPAHASTVRRDVDELLRVVRADRHELVEVAGAAHLAERAHQPLVVTRHAEDVTWRRRDKISMNGVLGHDSVL